MKDTLTIDQLKIQRAATKKRLEIMVRAGAEKAEVEKVEKYLKLLDKRIERSEKRTNVRQ